MVYNERKRQTFEFFSRRQWVEVPVYAVSVGMYPIRSSYRYLRKLHSTTTFVAVVTSAAVSSTAFLRGVRGGF
jgi:hypothetical protein